MKKQIKSVIVITVVAFFCSLILYIIKSITGGI